MKVLVCPLNWGLGHATRCVPIIRELQKQNFEVLLAADGGALELLKREFPELSCYTMPAYDISYPQKGSMILQMLAQVPKLGKAILQEHRWLHSFVKEHQVQVVISDNRFGAYAKGVHNIYITHQLSIRPPKFLSLLNFLGHWMHRPWMMPFQEIWLPDHQLKLSGWLGHSWTSSKIKMVGILSRFTAPQTLPTKTVDRLFLLSGPEPQRTELENKILAQMSSKPQGEKWVLLRGLPQDLTPIQHPDLEIHSHKSSLELEDLILRAKLIVCRSGYSTLMDLCQLSAKALLIPTPGQTEQEYLAEYLAKQKICPWLSQADMNLSQLPDMNYYTGFVQQNQLDPLLPKVIANLWTQK